MSALKNNKQRRINAAAAPDAIQVNALAWSVPTAPVPMEIGTEKNGNGDFVLRPKLMNSPVNIG